MDTESVVAQIDAEIAKLQQARAALLDTGTTTKVKTAKAKPAKRRKMSAAGRKAIADAQRARWAKVKEKK